MNLVSILKQSVNLYPQQIAIRGENFSYTYREFDVLTRNLAFQLQKAGIVKGSVVGVCMNRSAEMLIGIFGILRAGAAYLPVDPSNPKKRISALFADAGVNLIVTSNDLNDFVQSFGCQTFIPDINQLLDVSSDTLPEPDDGDVAYILFTSGSTGTPKGVMIEHHSVANLIAFIQKRYPLAQGDVVLFKSPYTFDGSVWELFGWMLMGGTLYVAPPAAEKDPRKLLQIIHQENIAFLFFVPSMLQAFLNYFPDKINLSKTKGLKWISVGGEVLPVTLVKSFHEKTGNYTARLINVYGPTETTVYATTFLCNPQVHYQKIPIGDAVDNDYIYVVDEDGNLVQDGVEGEILIGGEGVARGYLNNPELTAEKFLPDAFRGSGTMYRTGDIGKKNPDGTCDYTGRKDFQFKLRGLRIECGEIEHALLQTKIISECVVLVSQDHNQDDSIVAYIKLSDQNKFFLREGFQQASSELVSQIKSDISEWLPSFMIPAYFVVVERFELTSHGKTDRKLLPAITDVFRNEYQVDQTVMTDTEKLILDLWVSVLGKQSAGTEDDFFESGGHSLKAVQLISLIIKHTSYEIPLSVFYEGITIRKIAEGIDSGIYPYIQSDNPIVQVGDNKQGLNLTPVQTELWVMNNFDVTGLTHNIQVEFTVQGKVNIEKLKNAFTSTIQEEEILRSVFRTVVDIPMQFVQEHVDVKFLQADLWNESASEKLRIYEDICFKNGKTLFRTDVLPLFTLYLVRFSDEEYKILMSVHHLVFDGWSLYLFMEKILKRYKDEPVNRPAYRNIDYVNFLKNDFNRKKSERELIYWQEKLSNLSVRWKIPYKIDFNADEAGKYGDRCWWNVSSELSGKINKYALNNRTTPFVVFMTAFQISLAACENRLDVVAGTPFANRNNEIVNALIGYYTNMVSIRLSWKETTTLQSLIKQCNTNAIEAFSNATVPFGEIAKALGDKSELSKNPVFQAILVMQNWPHENNQHQDFIFSQKEIGNKTSKTDIYLNAEAVNDEYVCFIEYDTMLYDISRIKSLSEAIVLSLESIVKNDQLKIAEITGVLQGIILPDGRKSCYVAGEGKLAAQCASILTNKGFEIKSVISDDSWLREVIQADFRSGNALTEDCDTWSQVDYIFSINNSLILKDNFLSLAKEKSFNYHDSPLPEYAGMFASNWAILQNRSKHGVSWHEITGMIDGGDIYASEEFPILPDDSVLSLNTRCFEAAINSFERLTDDILLHRLKAVKQDLTRRSYFPLAQRPAFFGSFRPSMSVNEADCLIRATDFGTNFDNEFALPWILVNQTYYIVAAAEVFTLYEGKAGMFDVRDGYAGFYCNGGFIVLYTLYNPNLEIIKPAEVFSKSDRMSEPEAELCMKAAASFKKMAPYESFIKRTFEKGAYLNWPLKTFRLQDEDSAVFKLEIGEIPKISEQYVSITDYLIAAVSLLLLRLSGENSGTLAYIPGNISELLPEFFNDWLPLDIEPEECSSVNNSIRLLSDKLIKLRRSKSFVRSLQVRYPELRKNAQVLPEIFIIEGSDLLKSKAGKVNIFVSEDAIQIYAPQKQPICANEFLRSLKLFLKEISVKPETGYETIPLVPTVDGNNINQQLTIPNFPDVMHRFYQTVNQFPDKSAVVDKNAEITYKQLSDDIDRISEKIAPYLAGSESFVAIAMDRSYKNIVSMLAVLHCGAAFVPLDLSMPTQRQEFILKDAGVVLVLIDEHSEFETNISVPKINISDVLKSQSEMSGNQYLTKDDDAAYVIYTSGSTGKPKAVVIARSNLSAFISGATETYNISPEDKVLQFSSLTFDACIEEIFCSLCNGATLFLRTNSMLEANELLQFSAKHKISVWDLPTAYWRQLICTNDYVNSLPILHLRLVIIGGEAVFPADAELWQSHQPQHTLINTYGPTETTVVALTYELEKKSYDAIPIGRPLPAYETLIVDNNRQFLPSCAEGELLIYGSGVAKTYLNRPDDNAKAFVSMNIPGKGIQRCYCTGDKAFVDSDGLIYYLGRKDKQVKIRGFRVEIQEIEQQIQQTGFVSSCVVLVQQDHHGDSKLLAFCTAYHISIDFQIIREHLKNVLPAYMIPQEFYQLAEIPLTKNGKADQKALLEMAEGLTKKNQPVDEIPTTQTEQMLYDLWKKILAIENPGINEDFFDLGGHSLKAVALMAEVKKKTGVNIPLASLIQYPTIKKFASYLESKTTVNQWNCLVPVRTEGSKTPIFLVHGAGLNILLFQSLVKHLHPDRPIYAFQAAGLDGSKSLKDNIEDMAEEYIGELLKIQHQGPYYLLGFSLGGFIAYEMSFLLEVKGYTVGFTGLIDSVAYMADFTHSKNKKMLIGLWSMFFKPFFNLYLLFIEPASTKVVYLKKKLKNLRLSVLYVLSKSGFIQTKLLHRDVEQSSFLNDHVMILMNDALKRYKIKKSNIHIDLFKAGKSTFYILEPENYGWKKFALKGITKHVIPAEHSLLFAPPNDKMFAEIIDNRLDEIETNQVKC